MIIYPAFNQQEETASIACVKLNNQGIRNDNPTSLVRIRLFVLFCMLEEMSMGIEYQAACAADNQNAKDTAAEINRMLTFAQHVEEELKDPMWAESCGLPIAEDTLQAMIVELEEGAEKMPSVS
jgi:hypothetical protein